MTGIDEFHALARRTAESNRAELFAELDGIDLAEDERLFVCGVAWDGGTDELLSLLRKVRAGEQELPVSPAGQEYDARAERLRAAAAALMEPANDDTKRVVVEMIRRNREKVAEGGWPGMPIGWLSVRCTPSLHELIDEGRAELVTVTKRGKLPGSGRVEYAYVRLTEEVPGASEQ
ncbi:hypothetical protein ACFOWE_17945 [Planomonospora corallina]|uniref:Uncharacterized protein n=1 Tax=Planomonospora corallina TaxID=1806052 RepID=A0ABV8IAE5_9ACTN